jgi:hypothetical protein
MGRIFVNMIKYDINVWIVKVNEFVNIIGVGVYVSYALQK